MAGSKKRKTSGTAEREPQINDQRTKLTINSWEDVADSGDEFQISRDKILLEEEPARKRRRRIDEEYEELVPSDEEVLELPSSDEEEDVDEPEDISDTDENDTSAARRDEDGGDENETWGTSRKDYYNADKIETEVDALEEEEEALRLQKARLQGMNNEDFGFDETDWLADGKDVNGYQDDHISAEQVLPQLEISDDMPKEERMRILTSRYPEFEALSAEFVSLQGQYEELSAASAAYINSGNVLSGAVAKQQCLGAYLGILSMYFVLLMSGPTNEKGSHTAMDPARLRKHPIMESLIRARINWQKIKDIIFPDPEEATELPINGEAEDKPILTNGHTKSSEQKKSKKSRKSKAEIRALKAKEIADAERAARLQQTKADLAQIAAASTRNKGSLAINAASTNAHDDYSDFGETMTGDAGQQDRRKKSLAFYTSQIASKTQKRALAGKGAGGDEDIPYKERFRDRMARLNAQAQARGQNGKDQLGDDSEEEDARISAEVRLEADGEDYYQTIASAAQRKKEQKAARASALKEAQANGIRNHATEELGADGKRAITYAIEKNKGLTPKRKKEARNPRLKKRLKYQDKMKKLGSIRQLYKGGEGRGGYGGETTGIKSSTVRSRKL